MSTEHVSERPGENMTVEDELLPDALGDHPRILILTALIDNPDTDLNISQLAKLTGLARSTVYRHIERLCAYRLVEQTRTVGNSPMYAINRESPASEKLAGVMGDLLDVVVAAENADALDDENRPLPPSDW